MIALIAGTGALPGLLADALVAAGDVPVICEMAGFEPDINADLPRLRFQIETLGTLLATLKTAGVTRICMAGAVRRPVIDVTAIDALTAPLVPALQAAMAKGDDGTLRAIIKVLEERGFTIVGADQILPQLLPPPGVLTAVQVGAVHQADARIGQAEIAAMGRADMGQACVIRAESVIDREDAAGTDAMLRRLAVSRSSARTGDLAGVLFKAPKPGQDRRADLPVIGPGTAILAAQAGLAGIVIQAGGVMVIDQPQVVSILDSRGLFLWVRP